MVLNVDHARYSSLSLLKYINKNKIKTILVFNYELAVILVILRLMLRLKIKIISRNINTFSFKIKQFEKLNFWARYLVKPMIKHFYCKIDHVINQCIAMQDDFVKLYPKLKKNSSIIHNPLPAAIESYRNKNDFTKIKSFSFCDRSFC